MLPYRLRQIAFVTSDLAKVAGDFERAFGLPIIYRDPSVRKYGLSNALFPFGDSFLELVEPAEPSASAYRHRERLGGDGGYMLIFQGADALADRKKLVARGLTVIEAFGGDSGIPVSSDPVIAKRIEELSRRYAATHFHPRDFSGLLVSLDSVTGLDWKDPYGFWPPAETDGPPANRDLGIAEVTIDHPDAAAAADRWNDLLGATPSAPNTVSFTGSNIVFRQKESKVARIAEIGVRGITSPETIAGTLFRPYGGVMGPVRVS